MEKTCNFRGKTVVLFYFIVYFDKFKDTLRHC